MGALAYLSLLDLPHSSVVPVDHSSTGATVYGEWQSDLSVHWRLKVKIKGNWQGVWTHLGVGEAVVNTIE